jgi:hypothetical protein
VHLITLAPITVHCQYIGPSHTRHAPSAAQCTAPPTAGAVATFGVSDTVNLTAEKAHCLRSRAHDGQSMMVGRDSRCASCSWLLRYLQFAIAAVAAPAFLAPDRCTDAIIGITSLTGVARIIR